jgi:uncharacterized protein YneF (UPF0154 family)
VQSHRSQTNFPKEKIVRVTSKTGKMNTIAKVLIVLLIVLFLTIGYFVSSSATTATTPTSPTTTTTAVKTAVLQSPVLNSDVNVQTAGKFQDYLWGSFKIPSDFKSLVSLQIDYTGTVNSIWFGTYLTLWIQDTTSAGRLVQYYNGDVAAGAGNISGTTGAVTTLPSGSTMKANDACQFGITTYSDPELTAVNVTFTLKYR